MVSDIFATKFVTNFLEKGYKSAQVDASKIAEQLGFERAFPETAGPFQEGSYEASPYSGRRLKNLLNIFLYLTMIDKWVCREDVPKVIVPKNYN